MLTPNLLVAQESESNSVDETVEEAVQDVTEWWQQEGVREWVIDIPIRILVILVIALVLHWGLRRLVKRFANNNIKNGGKRRLPVLSILEHGQEQSEQQELMEEAQERRRQSRIKTLAGVLNSAISIIIWTWAVLAILSEIGVNVGPLIASAGVVGVALGFGAQSLVKDFLSGIFMLLEDQYGVGDTIDVGDDISGTVEEISLRITTLRDIDGTLWYVRNGEILRIGNMSDGYAIARIEIPVSLDNDAEKAWDVIQEAALSAAKHPDIANLIVEEPVVNGLTEVAPDHLKYRISVKTLPGDQWAVQRRTQAIIVDAMKEHDISVPYLHGVGIARPEAST